MQTRFEKTTDRERVEELIGDQPIDKTQPLNHVDYMNDSDFSPNSTEQARYTLDSRNIDRMRALEHMIFVEIRKAASGKRSASWRTSTVTSIEKALDSTVDSFRTELSKASQRELATMLERRVEEIAGLGNDEVSHTAHACRILEDIHRIAINRTLKFESEQK